MSIKESIAEINPDALLIDGFDEAIIGISECMRVVYSIDIILKVLINNGMSGLEAEEYFYYNIESAFLGEYTPIYVNRI